ncbi:hypothetical protein GCM10010191_31900 [Actinomadura vinacea]|uniref:Uncharacterized protein n=1 Tax=Actinomadura vinacea TaxID=115336 RepID=A0ABP5W6N1_9ACTN
MSKLENSRQTPTDDDVRQWAQATGSEAEPEYVVAPAHGFCLLDGNRVMVDTFSAELNLAQPQEIVLYRGIFDSLAAIASNGRSVRTIINQAIDDFAPEVPEDSEDGDRFPQAATLKVVGHQVVQTAWEIRDQEHEQPKAAKVFTLPGQPPCTRRSCRPSAACGNQSSR